MVFTPNLKISSMAKDLGVKSKTITELLAAHGITKGVSANLEPDEFSLVLELLTREKQISEMTEYLAGKVDILRPDEQRADVPNTQTSQNVDAATNETSKGSAAPTKPKVEQQAKPAPKAEEKPVQSSAQSEKAEKQETPEKKKIDTPVAQERKEQPTPQKSVQKEMTVAPKRSPKKQEQKKPAQKREGQVLKINARLEEQPGMPSAHVGKTRVVDTRSVDVDLSRYDEKLNTFVQENRDQYGSNKTKLKKQNNRPSPYGKKHNKNQGEQMKRPEVKKQPLNITIPEEIQVNELAAKLRVTTPEVIKRLMQLGVMATVNQVIDYDTAFLVADEMGANVTKEVVVTIEEKLFDDTEDAPESLVPRAPVVCVMGHVDHGKTSLLDAIRHTSVTSGEAGGITQHIGAYRFKFGDRDITFLDTPGHEAFTAMRARGAMATDIAILVVAADDGIMPQTVEAINHAKAADIPIIVAINKIDKPGANPEMVKQNLTKYDLVPEEWGGDTICVPVSALTKQGIEELMEMVLLVADVKELKANPNRRAKGIVIESKLDKGRGPVATVLVQNGTLHAGEIMIAGTAVGHVRAMTNERGQNLKQAGPSVPVEITGLSELPDAGDEFQVVQDERMARELADQRRTRNKEAEFQAHANVNLDDLFAQISGGVKDLNIIIKADVAGSAQAVKQSLEKLSNEEVKVRCIHTAVGGITENDVMLAAASNAIIVGFNVRPDRSALDHAARNKVDIRTYRVIYDCIEEVQAAMKGMLKPTYRENLLGHAEVRQTIHVPNVGTVAGCYVQDGKITRHAQIRVVRDGIVIFEDKISSLKRFKDDVREVAQGYECGVGLERFNDIKVGDVLEAFVMEEVAQV